MRCTVQLCTNTTEFDRWARDAIGQPFCPDHPVATACRMCGQHKGGNRVLCQPCANGQTPKAAAVPAPSVAAHPYVSAGHCGDCYRAWLGAPTGDEPDGPRCRYCGADCTDGRSYDGGDLHACPPCSSLRAENARLRRDNEQLLGEQAACIKAEAERDQARRERRQIGAQLTRVRDVLADMRNTTGASHWADALDTALAGEQPAEKTLTINALSTWVPACSACGDHAHPGQTCEERRAWVEQYRATIEKTVRALASPIVGRA